MHYRRARLCHIAELGPLAVWQSLRAYELCLCLNADAKSRWGARVHATARAAAAGLIQMLAFGTLASN